MDQPNKIRIMRGQEVRQRLGLTKSGAYRARQSRTIPSPLRLGPRSVGWPEHEIDIIAAAKTAGLSDEQLRETVTRLEAARSVNLDQMLKAVGA